LRLSTLFLCAAVASSIPCSSTSFASNTQPASQVSRLDQAWGILDEGVHHKSADERAKAIDSLSFLPPSGKGEAWAEAGLSDPHIPVRVSAANTLGRMGAQAARPKLRKALQDPEPAVVVTVANALYVLKDPIASEVYYEILTGEQKPANGLVKRELDQFKNRKYVEKLALQTGFGFVPFGGLGYQAWQTITADTSSAVRALAAERLGKDHDPKSLEALRVACTDKKWQVRAAAVSALGRSGMRSQESSVANLFSDDNDVVRYDAAVALINLESHRRRL
jgi:HEAT repeat protein